MNVLKALAKMTKLAAGLETENVDLRRDVEVSQKRELSIGDQVAIQREKIQSLEAKLFAAEQRGIIPLRCVEAVATIESLRYAWSEQDGKWHSQSIAAVPELPLPMFKAAVDKLNALGHAWSVPDQRWFDPVPLPPSAVPAVAPTPIDLPSVPCAPRPKSPRGLGWRDASILPPPQNMSEQIEAVLLNGVRKIRPASEFEWDIGLSTGVAWWRFDRPNRDDVEPAK